MIFFIFGVVLGLSIAPAFRKIERYERRRMAMPQPKNPLRDEIRALKNNPAYHDANHPDHGAVHARVSAILEGRA
jgi:hypothetical protein